VKTLRKDILKLMRQNGNLKAKLESLNSRIKVLKKRLREKPPVVVIIIQTYQGGSGAHPVRKAAESPRLFFAILFSGTSEAEKIDPGESWLRIGRNLIRCDTPLFFLVPNLRPAIDSVRSVLLFFLLQL